MTKITARFVTYDSNTIQGLAPNNDVLSVKLNASFLEANASGIRIKNEAITEALLNVNNAPTIHHVLSYDSRNAKEFIWTPQGVIAQSADRVPSTLTAKLNIRTKPSGGRNLNKVFTTSGSGDDRNDVMNIDLELTAGEIGYSNATTGWTGITTVGGGLDQAITEIELIKINYATINYVDSLITGLKWKAPVRMATTGNITLSGLQTIDGVSGVADDRVLVKNQTLGQNNGIYLMKSGAWVRSSDADTAAEIKGMAVLVLEGTVNADQGFTLITDGTIVIGTTVLNYVQFTGAGQINAGDGLGKTGNTLFVEFTSTGGIEFDSAATDLKKLKLKLKTNGWILTDADGVYVDVNGLVGAGMTVSGGKVVIDYTAVHNFGNGKLQVDGDEVLIPKIEEFVLTSTEITAKSVTLAKVPVAATVELTPFGGPLQRRTVDYSVSSSTVSWNALGLDGVLVSGDVLHIAYNY